MSSILRSGKFIRCFASAARTVLNSPKGFDNKLFQNTRSLKLRFSQVCEKTYATERAAPVSIEPLLQRLDADVRKNGRLCRHDLDEVLEEVRLRHSVTSSQSLLIIRCCGDLVPEELPETRTKLVNQIWQTLTERGIPMDISHYNALLRVYLENEHAFSPAEFLKELEERGLQPNRVTYQRLMWRYCQAGDVEGASRILELMREQRLPLSSAVLDALVLGHARQGDPEGARAVLAAMAGAGLAATPRTHALLLGGHARRGDLPAMQAILEECNKNEIYLSDKDFMEVVEDCAVSGHEEHIPYLLGQMQRSSGYNQEAVSTVLRLVTRGHIQAALAVYRTMTKPSSITEELVPTYQGAFFIRHLVRTDCPIDTMLTLCSQLKDEGHISKGYDIAAQTALQLGKVDMSIALLKAMNASGSPIRQHFFWPLLISEGKNNGIKGVLDIIKIMTGEFKINLGFETVRDYVLPNINNQDPNKTMEALRNAGVSVMMAGRSIVFSLLSKNRLKEAAELSTKYGINAYLRIINKQLIGAFLTTKDVKSLVTILHLSVSQEGQNKTLQNQEEANEEEEPADSLRQDEQQALIGQFLNDLIYQGKADCIGTLPAVLEELLKCGLGITNKSAEKIQERLGDKLTPEITDLMTKLLSEDLEPLLIENPNIPFLKRDSQQLETILTNAETRGESSGNLKRQLLLAYMREKNVEKVEQHLARLNQENYQLTSGTLGIIVDFYANAELLDKALYYKDQLSSKDPDFILDNIKIMRVANLMFVNGQYEAALQLLQTHPTVDQRPVEANRFSYNSLIWKILNRLAEDGSVDKLQAVYDTLIEKNYVEVSNSLLGPLIKVHIVNGNIDLALDNFEKFCRMHRCTPWKAELTRRLITEEDAAGLQRLTDLSTAVHGEVNSLYDLVFGFVECGRLRQARRILETPGLRSRNNRFSSACERYGQDGKVECLEGLLEASRELSHIDRSEVFQQLLFSYTRNENTEKALGLWTLQQEEGVPPTDKFLVHLASYLRSKGEEIPFVIPNIEILQKSQPIVVDKTKSVKVAVKEVPVRHRISDISQVVEARIKENNLSGATEMALQALKENQWKNFRILKFLMTKLSEMGDFASIETIGNLINEEQKKMVSFNNKYCKAHILAGKGMEYLDVLNSAIDATEDQNLPILAASFPQGALLDFISNDVNAFSQYEKLAAKYASRGITIAQNVLWIHFIRKGLDEQAKNVWDQHLKNSNRIYFSPLLKQASEPNTNIPLKLIKYLRSLEAATPAALGLAYSSLIYNLVDLQKYDEALKAIDEAVSSGVTLNYLNESCLLKTKTAVENQGGLFQYEIPSKRKNTSV